MRTGTIIAMAILSLSLIITPVASSVHKEKRVRHIEHLEQELERRDAFIREYLDTLYRLKDEFVLNESNERTIHALDSLGYGLGKETGIFDYTLYALDVNHLQEKLRREAEERCAGR